MADEDGNDDTAADRTAETPTVWRVHPLNVAAAGGMCGVVSLAALVSWVVWCVHPTAADAVRAGVPTAFAVVLGLVLWSVVLRPRVELYEDVVVIVNPTATYRLAVADIVDVTGGVHGAAFHRTDGFHTNAAALGGRYDLKGDRIAALRAALAARGTSR